MKVNFNFTDLSRIIWIVVCTVFGTVQETYENGALISITQMVHLYSTTVHVFLQLKKWSQMTLSRVEEEALEMLLREHVRLIVIGGYPIKHIRGEASELHDLGQRYRKSNEYVHR